MKFEATKVPAPVDITITVDAEGAEVIRALAGNVGVDASGISGRIYFELGKLLYGVGNDSRPGVFMARASKNGIATELSRV